MKTFKPAILLVAMFISAIAHAACEPNQAIGPILYQEHASGALLIAFKCPDKSTVAFAARAEWKPRVPPYPIEVVRLLTMHSYDADPNYLQLEATKLLAAP